MKTAEGPGPAPPAEAGKPVADPGAETIGVDCHAACIACRPRRDGGLGLRFRRSDSGGVVARFESEPFYQGYPDRLHGGIIATLLDAAMTHCLFARQTHAHTAKLCLHYRRPVILGPPVTVHAEVIATRPPWFSVRSGLRQHGEVRVQAEALFRAFP